MPTLAKIILSLAFLVLLLGLITNDIISRLPTEICLTPASANPESSEDNHPTLFRDGDLQAVSAQSFAPTDIGSRDSQGTFRVLIVPVGYSNSFTATGALDAHFSTITTQAETVWQELGLDVRYSYLRRSLPLPIYVTDNQLRAPTVDSLRPTLDATWTRLSDETDYTFHVMAIYVNTNANVRGSAITQGRYQVLSDATDRNLAVLIHETAHNLSLNDGYDKNYQFRQISRGQNSELFFSTEDLLPKRQALLEATHTGTVATRFNCADRPVLAPAGSPESLMAVRYTNDDLWTTDGRLNPNLFTPYQLAIMRDFIATKLAETP